METVDASACKVIVVTIDAGQGGSPRTNQIASASRPSASFARVLPADSFDKGTLQDLETGTGP